MLALFDDGKIDRSQEESLLVGHDRRNDVDHLRQVGHLHDIGAAEEHIEKHAHRQRVLRTPIDFLSLGWISKEKTLKFDPRGQLNRAWVEHASGFAKVRICSIRNDIK
jgi:hypothetical protein